MMNVRRTQLAYLLAATSLITAEALVAQRPPDFPKPEIRNVVLEDDCLALLRSFDARLDAAGATQRLLAWSPLMLLAGETSAPHAAFSILTTNWDDLARAIPNVGTLALTGLATDALVHSSAHENNPTLKQFWRTLSDFYAYQTQLPTIRDWDRSTADRQFQGTWEGEGHRYGFTMQLPVRDQNIDGSIVWTLLAAPAGSPLASQINATGTERVRGRFDPATWQFTLTGYAVDNPDLIGIDVYRFVVSPDGLTIRGTTRTNAGDWSATLRGRVP